MLKPTHADRAIAEHIYLCDQVHAMRYLRPGTELPHIKVSLAQQMRDDLLRLPDKDNTLHWLEEERGQATALLALSLAIDLAARMRRSGQQSRRLHMDWGAPSENVSPLLSTEWETILFGRLLSTNDSTNDISMDLVRVSETLDETVASTILINIWTQMRRECALPVERNPSISRSDPGLRTLLADLLRLPDMVDPLQWLHEERGAFCAYLVLAYLIRQSLPPAGIIATVGAYTRPSLRLKGRPHVAGDMSVRLDQIDFHELGFSLHLRARFRAMRPPLNESHLDSSVVWEGFSRVIDDYGYRYLVQATNRQVAKLPWRQGRWQERLTLICSPALGSARKLMLQSSPATIATYYVPQFGNELIPLPSPTLGEITVQVELPS